MPESTQLDEQGREVVRVRDKSTGHKYTQLLHVVNGDPEVYQILKQDAVDSGGRLLEPEYNTDSPAPSGQKATTSKENN